MTALTRAKLALALVGLILWGYGVRAESVALRWTGIGFLALAVLLRFWPRRVPPAE
jgi:hypothetical protein